MILINGIRFEFRVLFILVWRSWEQTQSPDQGIILWQTICSFYQSIIKSPALVSWIKTILGILKLLYLLSVLDVIRILANQAIILRVVVRAGFFFLYFALVVDARKHKS